MPDELAQVRHPKLDAPLGRHLRRLGRVGRHLLAAHRDVVRARAPLREGADEPAPLRRLRLLVVEQRVREQVRELVELAREEVAPRRLGRARVEEVEPSPAKVWQRPLPPQPPVLRPVRVELPLQPLPQLQQQPFQAALEVVVAPPPPPEEVVEVLARLKEVADVQRVRAAQPPPL